MANAIEAPAQSINAEGPTSHTQNQALEARIRELELRLEQEAAKSAGTFGYTREEQMKALHRLREPFPQSEVRYRPQPWCKACSKVQGWPKVCQNHHEIRCQRCNGQKITEAHICLKYIGHAEATNRMLNVDPFWDWEPLALDDKGLPQYDGNRALWIRLTVCGMSRIGYGDATGKEGANAVKEIIGDAIRNAGMRFGMALDLWTQSELEILESGSAPVDSETPPKTPPRVVAAPAASAVPQSVQKPQAPSRDEVLDKLYRQAIANRSHVDVLKQIAGAAKAEKVIDMEVDGPPPAHERMTLGALIDLLVADAQAANAERNAA